MKQWTKIADAMGVPLSDPERVAAVLDALEANFRPLTQQIPHDCEPAPAFHALERKRP